MTFAIESRIKSVARTRVTSNSVFSNPRRVRKTAESLPNVDPNPLVLDCMRMMTISSNDSRIWAACRYGAKGYLLPISVMAGVRLPIIAYGGGAGVALVCTIVEPCTRSTLQWQHSTLDQPFDSWELERVMPVLCLPQLSHSTSTLDAVWMSKEFRLSPPNLRIDLSRLT